ncbi:hypothetical protein [Bacillus sp. 7894-2]|uniref:hypothetical protein n=1 Tax=Bacillus sp. 7894-2 TaxID=2021695 RepID=UPI000BA70CE8|nr:hypothetical protein [Bacillus sp. 7894-2]PAE26032.1 hypothetical protein CHI10_04555 [Bacillus sp. 7894-2]
MKIIKIGLVGMLAVGLLTACNGNDAKSVAKTDDQPAAVENDTVEFSPEAKEWIAEMAAEFNRAPEESFDELKQEDVGFVYYTKANDLYENMQHYIDDKNESFDEDFANLRMLAAGISHDHLNGPPISMIRGKKRTTLNMLRIGNPYRQAWRRRINTWDNYSTIWTLPSIRAAKGILLECHT